MFALYIPLMTSKLAVSFFFAPQAEATRRRGIELHLDSANAEPVPLPTLSAVPPVQILVLLGTGDRRYPVGNARRLNAYKYLVKRNGLPDR
jgi:hypothetical protein